MSTVELQRLNDQIEEQLIQRRNFFIRPSDQAPPDELTELEENLRGWPREIRLFVLAATHELFQEKQFDYQYSGILSS